ncbi:tRNA guanosine(34) transglycosylase Tgt [Candidatus Roizmanbacteria bacterium]|nr:MAG: tRNA guanosine(34) transglycosylase Tgt [Candidatus Roizmanbacteria bacterium]
MATSKFFTVHHKSKKSKARIGTIQTSHGEVQTPTFVPCATKGTLKGILPEQIPKMNVQLMFVNTYHLVTHPGSSIIKNAGGIHKYSKLPTPLMSDSGGFQVFSLGKNERRTGKLRGDTNEEPLLVKISEDGVKFRSVHDGALIEFTPESSIKFQQEIGADLMMAFDECTYLNATHEYAKKSVNRTHDWLLRCIKEVESYRLQVTGSKQYLYGIIQGGQFEDLRKESAKFVTNQAVDGIAIGGVSVGESKEEMRKQVEWCSEFLPDDKPVHLLGIGQLDDIRDLVVHGIDTFDCVEPTRIARLGRIYQWDTHKTGEIDIQKAIYRDNFEKIDPTCDCWACLNFTKSYLHHLFKQRELLGYTIATFHNVFTVERYMNYLRDQIALNKI